MKKEGSNLDDESAREPNNIQNVYKEFNNYARKIKIEEFRSAEVTKLYAFEREGVPKKSEYLEIRYPATEPAVDPDYSGPAIEGFFGANVNGLELLLIEKNINGPCWLDIKNPLPVDNSFSWSKVQVRYI